MFKPKTSLFAVPLALLLCIGAHAQDISTGPGELPVPNYNDVNIARTGLTAMRYRAQRNAARQKHHRRSRSTKSNRRTSRSRRSRR